jgi:hypothetical protein
MRRRGPDAASTTTTATMSGSVGSLEGAPHDGSVATAHTSAPGGLAGPVVERSSSILRSIASPAVSDEPSLVLVPLHSFDSHELTLGDETDLSPP